MKVQELIALLQNFNRPDAEVMVLDGPNGGGVPRTINVGPIEHTISPTEEKSAYDCEGKAGKKVIVMGYGGY